ncbi:hypothetical protein [Labrys monachus]|uniref:Mannosyltransferase n=1 Tax=Labrys monachus TaxID=217067 RepID=A0ABU0FBN0_9HYPH|nr:hypothetical protein [Labrys monachus]MDQ0392018.1 hypothetical protein [Labrys monachus]
MIVENARQQTLLAERLNSLEPYPGARFAGRGIVVCAGGPSFFTNAYVLVHVLREALQCRLPIEVWHLGPAEMSARMAAMLGAFGVRVVDATAGDADHAWIVDGWQLKAHALAWSSFEEVLLLDADQVPTRDPAEVFEWADYRETGAVLWPDIVDLIPENPVWDACGLAPRSAPAIESGQLLIHKARKWPAIQLALHLNRHADFYYRMMYGDKETYLLGLLMADSRFAVIPHRPLPDVGLCLHQHDFEGRVLFQHRTGAKWRYAGGQEEPAGFVGLEACMTALAQLRKGWNGLVFHAPPRSAHALRTEREWASFRTLAFIVPGQAAVTLELLPDGEIGRSRAADRMNWWCDEKDGALHLVIHDAFGPCWRLEYQANRHWYGASVADPAIEAYAAAEGVRKSSHASDTAWRQWIFAGRYVLANDGDI